MLRKAESDAVRVRVEKILVRQGTLTTQQVRGITGMSQNLAYTILMEFVKQGKARRSHKPKTGGMWEFTYTGREKMLA
jgi:hypothetical protein